jgi:hypothetical protein
MVVGIRDVNVTATLIDFHASRAAQICCRGRAAVPSESIGTGSRKRDDSAVGPHLAHTVIIGVRDVHPVVGSVHTHAVRMAQRRVCSRAIVPTERRSRAAPARKSVNRAV